MNKALIVKIVSITAIVALIAINLKFFAKKITHTEDIDMALRIGLDQQIANNLSDYIKTKYPDYKKRGIYFHASYFSIPLDVDIIEPTFYSIREGQNFPKGSLYIWDNWYSVMEGGMMFENLWKDTVNWKRDTILKTNENVPNGQLTLALFIRK